MASGLVSKSFGIMLFSRRTLHSDLGVMRPEVCGPGSRSNAHAVCRGAHQLLLVNVE
jgi:hypothetical protein